MKPLLVERKAVKLAQPEGGELPRDVSQWASRIRDEWLKVAPYAYQYPTEIVLEEMTDAEKGAAFGHILLTSRTRLNPGQAIGQMGTEIGIRTVKIPIVIQDFRLYPFDMIKTEDGRFLPLNESRLGEALFRPSMFDSPARGDMVSLFGNPLYPPSREKAAQFPMLHAVSDTVHADQFEVLEQHLQKDGSVRGAVLGNPITRAYFLKAASIEPQREALKTASDFWLAGRLDPDVLLVNREGSDEGRETPVYQVKVASRHAYDDTPAVEMSRAEALRTLGDRIVKEADLRGIMVIIKKPKGDEPFEIGEGPSLLDRSGPCRVIGSGRPMMGWLMNKVLNVLSGHRSPFRLFSDGDNFGLQEDIGAFPEENAKSLLSSDTPHGWGSFCWEDEQGELTCTEPLECSAEEGEGGRRFYLCRSADGRDVRVLRSASVRTLSPASSGTVLVPESARWISLGTRMVRLDGRESAQQHIKNAARTCSISYSGGAYHLDGLPLRKISSRSQLGPMEALYTLGLLGFSKESAERVLAKAFRQGQVKVAGVSEVTALSDLQRRSQEKTAALGSDLDREIHALRNLSYGLLKEAASLGDADSVDAVLSLGFLNIDNISRFVSFIPAFESTQHRLGTLLLAARLGLSELPQDHLLRAFFALEHVLVGLRRLSARLNSSAQA